MALHYLFRSRRILFVSKSMIRNSITRALLLGWILYTVALNVGPSILRALEYRTYESVAEAVPRQPAEQPSTEMYAIENDGHKNWIVNVPLSVHITNSVKVIRHIYVFGVIADWLELLDSLDTLRDIYDIIAMPLMLSLIVILLTKSKKLAPTWIDP